MGNQRINIIWFKRDLRLIDHQPLQRAQESDIPTLLIYFYEPSIMSFADSDERHWRFVQQSLTELNKTLSEWGHRIYTVHEEALPALQKLTEVFDVATLFSHEEIGNNLTYVRDQSVAAFCKEKKIEWKEFPTNGVVRGLGNRNLFSQRWIHTMGAPLYSVDLKNLISIQLPADLLLSFTTSFPANPRMQPGGPAAANQYLTSFLYERKSNYSKHISKPEESRKSCSRL